MPGVDVLDERRNHDRQNQDDYAADYRALHILPSPSTFTLERHAHIRTPVRSQVIGAFRQPHVTAIFWSSFLPLHIVAFLRKFNQNTWLTKLLCVLFLRAAKAGS
jgi:hypothetical protein